MTPASPALTPEVLQAAIDYADEHTLQKPEDDYMARWRANVCARLSLSALTPDQVAERLTILTRIRNAAVSLSNLARVTKGHSPDYVSGDLEVLSQALERDAAVLVEAITAGLPASPADEPRPVRPPQMGPAYDPVVEQHRDLIRPTDGAALQPPPTQCPRCRSARQERIVGLWLCNDCGHEWDTPAVEPPQEGS